MSVNVSTFAGQAFEQSLYDQYASWGGSHSCATLLRTLLWTLVPRHLTLTSMHPLWWWNPSPTTGVDFIKNDCM